MIKYIGSKRRLVPVLGELSRRLDARSALDLFTGTTRVAQELKRAGARVTAVDTLRCAHTLARCYVATDARAVDGPALARELARLQRLPGRAGYFTETFCEQARYLRPENGRRVDAIRDEIARAHAGSPLEPLLLTSLLEAADRVDSTTGVQMAYLKRWAPRSARLLQLRAPALIPRAGAALRGDALELAGQLDPVDLAYLDPPYNHHSYLGNYHVWETLVAWDSPACYGVARKREECRNPAARSAFNSKRRFRDALAGVIAGVRARVVALSYNDESWITLEELIELCGARGAVGVLAFDQARYVGARIGIHDRQGRRVGRVGRLRNVEYLLVCGEPADVRRAAPGALRWPASLRPAA